MEKEKFHKASHHRLYVVKMQGMDGNRELNRSITRSELLGRPSVSTLPTEVVLRLHQVSVSNVVIFK